MSRDRLRLHAHPPACSCNILASPSLLYIHIDRRYDPESRNTDAIFVSTLLIHFTIPSIDGRYKVMSFSSFHRVDVRFSLGWAISRRLSLVAVVVMVVGRMAVVLLLLLLLLLVAVVAMTSSDVTSAQPPPYTYTYSHHPHNYTCLSYLLFQALTCYERGHISEAMGNCKSLTPTSGVGRWVWAM